MIQKLVEMVHRPWLYLSGTCWRILILLADQPLDAQTLASQSCMARSTIYTWLRYMSEKSLISVYKKGNQPGIYSLM